MNLGAGAVKLVEWGSERQGGRKYPWQPSEQEYLPTQYLPESGGGGDIGKAFNVL